MDDEALIRALSAGEHTALRALFERHAPWVAARLRRPLPADAVEDVLQETFIAVWRGAGRYQSQGEVGAWLRKHDRHDPVFEIEDANDATMAAVQRADLQQALARLGPTGAEPRELARLVFIEERSVRYVARILEIPEGTVKSRVHRLRRRLRAYLSGDDR